jgi:uncharacterized protein YcsI (UPF0317 family)
MPAVANQSGNPSITTATDARRAMRRNEWIGYTNYRAPGYVQTNLVVLPKSDAYDFLLYCQRNPKSCPLLEVTEPGDPEPRFSAPGADLRTDLARYAVYRDGRLVEEVTDIRRYWRRDSVAFLIGSSLTFDEALERADIPRSQIWVLDTSIPTVPAGKFHGPLVVTMRWMTPAQAIVATQLTARFHAVHGAPVHVGDPRLIGARIDAPHFGPVVKRIPRGVMPVFWACGVTPQRAAIASKCRLMITHVSGYAFITDLKSDQICQP